MKRYLHFVIEFEGESVSLEHLIGTTELVIGALADEGIFDDPSVQVLKSRVRLIPDDSKKWTIHFDRADGPDS